MLLHVQSAISSSFIKQRCEWCRQKKKSFELLEIVGEPRQGRMDATSQETLDMRMFGVDGGQVLW